MRRRRIVQGSQQVAGDVSGQPGAFRHGILPSLLDLPVEDLDIYVVDVLRPATPAAQQKGREGAGDVPHQQIDPVVPLPSLLHPQPALHQPNRS